MPVLSPFLYKYLFQVMQSPSACDNNNVVALFKAIVTVWNNRFSVADNACDYHVRMRAHFAQRLVGIACIFVDNELQSLCLVVQNLVYGFDIAAVFRIFHRADVSDNSGKDNSDNTNGGSDADTHNCPSKDFDDLDTSLWYHGDMDYVLSNGLMNGTADKTFAPNENLTRAMLVTILYRNEGKPEISGSAPFEDVAGGAYYADAVDWAYKNGIVKGISETMFAPDNNITREQIAAIMYRYAQYKGYDTTDGENTNILSYNDFDSISEYAIGAMQYACGSGLIKGRTESTLNPNDNATRAEIAAVLHRFIENNK